MIVIEGKYGIKATILADSISKAGVRFLTFEIEYPRLVLAELNTHKMLSKNSFSSRAVPFDKMLQQLSGEPVRFGANQSGMQDQGFDFDAPVEVWEEPFGIGEQGKYVRVPPRTAWQRAKEAVIGFAQAFKEAGYHKQVYNRLLEPFQMMKTVISGTELENFFWLRDHFAADPSLGELARVMNEARNASTPKLLEAGEWHLPYVDTIWVKTDADEFPRQAFFMDDIEIPLDVAIKVSCARCAAVSYRNEGYGVEKSLEVYDRLVGDERKHASAFEHQATPVREWGYYPHSGRPGCNFQQNHPWIPYTWEEGITHVTRDGKLWSGNLKGWRQYRKLIPGENYTGE